MSNELTKYINRSSILYGEVHRLRAELARTSTENATNIDAITSELTTLRSELGNRKNQLIVAAKGLKVYQGRIARSETLIDDLNRQLETDKTLGEQLRSELEAEVQALKVTIANEQAHARSIREKMKTLEDGFKIRESELLSKNEGLELSLRDRDGRLVELKNKLSELQGQYQREIDQLNINASNRIQTISLQNIETITGLKDEIDSLRRNNHAVQQINTELEREVAETKQQLEVATRKTVVLSVEVDRVTADLSEAEEERQALSEQCVFMAEEVEHKQKALDGVTAENSVLASAIEELQKRQQSFEGLKTEISENTSAREALNDELDSQRQKLAEQEQVFTDKLVEAKNREQMLEESLRKEMNLVVKLQQQIEYLKNSPAISELGSIRTDNVLPFTAKKEKQDSTEAVPLRSWKVRNGTLTMLCAIVGLPVVFLAWGLTFPTSNMEDAVTTKQVSETYKPLVSSITPIETINEDRSEVLDLKTIKPSQSIASRPDGTIRSPSTRSLKTLQIATAAESFRTFSLPEYLLETAVSMANAQTNDDRSVLDERSINYPLVQQSVDVGSRAGQAFEDNRVNAPSVSEHIQRLIDEGVITPDDIEDLAVLSTKQTKPELSINDAREYRKQRSIGASTTAGGENVKRVSRDVTKTVEDDVALTYYGELLEYKKQQRAEKVGVVPHSKNRGGRVGKPSAPRNVRVSDFLDGKANNPDDILRSRALLDAEEAALHSSLPINHRIRTINYTESEIPVINVARGQPVSLSFLDKFGNPYPIADITPKKANELVEVSIKGKESEGATGNIAEVTGLKLAGSTTIQVLLHGRVTSAPFQIQLNNTENDTKTTVMMPKAAPGFEQVSRVEPTGANDQLCSGDNLVESVLQGVFPQSLNRLPETVENLQAFQSAGKVYLRSNHEIVTPGCDCLVYGPEGLNVCRVPASAPIVLYMDDKQKKMQRFNLAQLIK